MGKLHATKALRGTDMVCAIKCRTISATECKIIDFVGIILQLYEFHKSDIPEDAEQRAELIEKLLTFNGS